jgi:hypothetical protein
MRLLLILLLALPAYAEAPGAREVKFVCQDGYCLMSEADWRWVVRSMKAKDEELARLMRGCGPWRFD